jgi:hypothetical protein
MLDIPNVGDCFLMELPLTPPLREEYGKDSFIVEAVYHGTLTDEEVEVQKADGSLMEMYNRLDINEHHIVFFSDQRWVNDLLDVDPEKISFEPLI